MQRVVIIGAGGHAQVVADILMRMRDTGEPVTPVGYLDDNPTLQGQTRLGIPVLGRVGDLGRIPHDAVIVALGDNGTRRRIFERLSRAGEQFAIAQHPSAVIAPDVRLGRGSMVCARAVVNPGAILGDNIILNTASTVDHHSRIGDHAHLAPGVHTGGEVDIGEGCLIGIGATVMPRCRVGDRAVVGAGALVQKDLPADVVAVGVPARPVRRVEHPQRKDTLPMNRRIYLSPPHMSGRELDFVHEAFETNWIAPLGPNVDAFEAEFCAAVGAPHALALSSGTAALHLALMLAGVSTGDEVLVSTLTFSASANPVVYLGARPTFIDSEARSWNMDPDLLAETLEKRARAGRLPKAVVLVHIYGQTADLEPILAACRRYGVPLIEDAAEALGADYHGRAAGTFDLAGVYSFNGNKIITTSGGGMLVSADQALIDHARKLATQAREPAPHYQHAEIGYNYRMSNLLAGVGRGQLRVLEERVAARRRNFDYYRQALGDLPGLTFQPEAPWGRHTRWLTCLTIDPALFGADREAVRLALERDNIEARPVWKPMHLQPVFAECDYIGSHVAQRLFENGLCLPSGSSLTEEELERICAIIRSACPAVQPRRSATVRLAPESQSVASAS